MIDWTNGDKSGSETLTDNDSLYPVYINEIREAVDLLEEGWIDTDETWEFSAANDPLFDITVSGDKRSKYLPGMMVKITQTMPGTQALELDEALSQYAHTADTAALSITGDMTIEAWIWLEQLPSDAGHDFDFVTKYRDDDAYGYQFEINSGTNKFLLRFRDSATGGNQSQFQSLIPVTADDVGHWFHVAVVVDVSAPSATFYKNGVNVGSYADDVAATSIYDNDVDLAIGARHKGTGLEKYHDGKIKDVRLWNDKRTITEIKDNMFSTLVGTEGNLVAYWKLDGNGEDTVGSSDLTLENGASYSTDNPSGETFYLIDKVVYDGTNTTLTLDGMKHNALADKTINDSHYSYVRAPIIFPNFYNPNIYCHAYLSADQSIPTGESTKVLFNTVGRDLRANFDISNSKFVCSVPGIYLVIFNYTINSLADGDLVQSFIKINGAPPAAYENGSYRANYAPSNGNISFNNIDMLNLIKGDDVSFHVQHNHGSNLDLASTHVRTSLAIALLIRK